MIPFVILFLLVSFGSVSAVLCSPALPEMQQFFGISVGKTQFIITSYLIGYALGQLPYGPLANAIGRKKTLYIGLGVSIFGALLCVSSSFFHSFPLLIVARIIQALGACVGLKMSFTMVLDVYDAQTAPRYIARFLIAFAIMPGIATAIGGLLVQWFAWESCFYFLALFGMVMFGVVARLRETSSAQDLQELNWARVFSSYRKKLQNKPLVLCALIVGSMTGIVYVFAARAPFIGINLLEMSPAMFGVFNCLPSIGMLLGSFSTVWMMKKVPSARTLMGIGIAGAAFFALCMLLGFVFLSPSIALLFIPMSLLYIPDAWVFTTGPSLGLMTVRDKSNASAVYNFINIGMALLATLFAEKIYPESAVSLPCIMVALFCLVSVLYCFVKEA